MVSKFVESLAFFRIVLSPLLVGAIVGLGFYLYFQKNEMGVALLGICLLLGLVAGIIWAVKVTKKRSATDFISKVNASPDIDKAVRNKN